MNKSPPSWLPYLLTSVAFAAGFAKLSTIPAAAPFATDTAVSKQSTSATKHLAAPSTRFVSPIPGPHRHGASLVELSNGQIAAFWFSGSDEMVGDVEIRSAAYDPQQGQWSAEQTVTDRASTQRDLQRYIKTLGNPVVEKSSDGTLHLFYVTVSLGGWAGSSITTRTSTDNGATWSPARRLITSPFINISTLDKGTPFHYADGSIGLPVYHEFIGKFAEILRLDTQARIVDKQRLSDGRLALQPVVLVQNANQAQVLMRHGKGGAHRVLGVSTSDGGQHWTAPQPLTLANPDAAVSGLVLPDGTWLATLNNIENNRDALSLMVSSDEGASWQVLLELEGPSSDEPLDPTRYGQAISKLAHASDVRLKSKNNDALIDATQKHMCKGQHCNNEYSYPYMLRGSTGDVQIVYTWQRSLIKHVSLPAQWLEQKLKAGHGKP